MTLRKAKKNVVIRARHDVMSPRSQQQCIVAATHPQSGNKRVKKCFATIYYFFITVQSVKLFFMGYCYDVCKKLKSSLKLKIDKLLDFCIFIRCLINGDLNSNK